MRVMSILKNNILQRGFVHDGINNQRNTAHNSISNEDRTLPPVNMTTQFLVLTSNISLLKQIENANDETRELNDRAANIQQCSNILQNNIDIMFKNVNKLKINLEKKLKHMQQ
ncbi:Hypothetical_protein [Hexamita inflata]|uniref:Hypothetical_protein n=1 Tax=Hexamita inflata TaxID=28002 RepID=A0ABP1GFI1_9EUKA